MKVLFNIKLKLMMELDSWFYKNNLLLNTEKTKVVSFHTTQNRNPLKPQVTFNNTDIGYKSELKFLGIYITENLKSNVQVRHLSQKLSKVYCIIISKESNEPTYNKK
jgi:hypothetical protein